MKIKGVNIKNLKGKKRKKMKKTLKKMVQVRKEDERFLRLILEDRIQKVLIIRKQKLQLIRQTESEIQRLNGFVEETLEILKLKPELKKKENIKK